MLALDFLLFDKFDLNLPREYRRIKRGITAGCREQVFKAMRCPVCGSPLYLDIHPKRDLFFVMCTSSSLHLAMHGKLRGDPQAWWDEHVSGDWLD